MAVTREQLIQKLQVYAADDYTEDQAPFLEDCIDGAIQEVCNEMCPWGMSDSDYEKYKNIALQRYSWAIYRIAQFHYDKQGKEGVTTFYEAGQTTSFESGGTPKQFLSGIIPIAKIV